MGGDATRDARATRRISKKRKRPEQHNDVVVEIRMTWLVSSMLALRPTARVYEVRLPFL